MPDVGDAGLISIGAICGVDSGAVMNPDEIIATIHRLLNPEWEKNLRRWIAVAATGKDESNPSDAEIRKWLSDPEVQLRVTALVRRIPQSWLEKCGEK